MRERITLKHIQNVLDRINIATGNPTEGWTKRPDGTFKCNVGTYVLDECYGGVRLAQLCSDGGGERDITGLGTKREVYYQMRAFLAGVETKGGE